MRPCHQQTLEHTRVTRQSGAWGFPGAPAADASHRLWGEEDTKKKKSHAERSAASAATTSSLASALLPSGSLLKRRTSARPAARIRQRATSSLAFARELGCLGSTARQPGSHRSRDAFGPNSTRAARLRCTNYHAGLYTTKLATAPSAVRVHAATLAREARSTSRLPRRPPASSCRPWAECTPPPRARCGPSSLSRFRRPGAAA